MNKTIFHSIPYTVVIDSMLRNEQERHKKGNTWYANVLFWCHFLVDKKSVIIRLAVITLDRDHAI